MTINLSVPSNNDSPNLKPKITVIGVGGAGGNAVDNMIALQLEGVDFIVANTDSQALSQSRADRHIQLGAAVTQGLGAGARPETGAAAAKESLDAVMDEIGDSNMSFIAAGMGGGTGSGAAPIIARACREKGILTVGVVTKPFHFEGDQRMKVADAAIEELSQNVDTLIVIPNQNLFRVANEKTTFADAFAMADDVLYSGVRGVTDLMVMPGLINLDFADIRSVMSEMGKAMMGTGEADGDKRALDAAEAAIANPLLDDISMKGAKRILINITGGKDMTLFEVDEAATRIRAEVDTDAHTIFGSTFDDTLEGRIRVSVVATGMDSEAMSKSHPTVIDMTEQDREKVVEMPTTVVEIMPSADEKDRECASDMPGDEAACEASQSTDEAAVPDPVEDAGEKAAVAEAITPPPAPATPALGATDIFVPPAPASPSGGEEKAADPFAAAAMANGAKTSAEDAADGKKPELRSRKVSLFERVTRTGRAARPKVRQVHGDPFMEGNQSVQESDNASSLPGHSENSAAQIDSLDHDNCVADNQVEDSLLDIPAFLRRQAN